MISVINMGTMRVVSIVPREPELLTVTQQICGDTAVTAQEGCAFRLPGHFSGIYLSELQLADLSLTMLSSQSSS
jgi:hypothetical protein